METKYTNNSQFETKADCVDYYLEKKDLSDVDTLVLAGVALKIHEMLQENSDASEAIKSGEMPGFPHPGIGLVENPTQKTRIVMSKIIPRLANEIFENSVRE